MTNDYSDQSTKEEEEEETQSYPYDGLHEMSADEVQGIAICDPEEARIRNARSLSELKCEARDVPALKLGM